MLIAAHARPDLDVEGELRRLDELASQFEGQGAAALRRWLVEDQGFLGNTSAYYDDRNSMLDQVLTRRLGIPITLSVVMIEVGRRRGVDLVGIGMPGEFLVREAHDANAFHNVFRHAELDLGGVERLFRRMHGLEARFDSSMLNPCGPVEIVSRMLANLIGIHLQTMDRSSLAWVLRLRTLLPDAPASEYRQLAGVLEHLGRFWDAADVLDDLALLRPDQSDVHRRSADRLRARLN